MKWQGNTWMFVYAHFHKVWRKFHSYAVRKANSYYFVPDDILKFSFYGKFFPIHIINTHVHCNVEKWDTF